MFWLTDIWTTPYGKDKYLQVTSYHPLGHKTSIITILTDGAKMICGKSNQAAKHQHVKSTSANGSRTSIQQPRLDCQQNKTDHTAYLPYIHSTDDYFSKLLKKKGYPHGKKMKRKKISFTSCSHHRVTATFSSSFIRTTWLPTC
jgi:hypothetical protein